MGTEFPWRWGRGTISANLDVIWGMSVESVNDIAEFRTKMHRARFNLAYPVNAHDRYM